MIPSLLQLADLFIVCKNIKSTAVQKKKRAGFAYDIHYLVGTTNNTATAHDNSLVNSYCLYPNCKTCKTCKITCLQPAAWRM